MGVALTAEEASIVAGDIGSTVGDTVVDTVGDTVGDTLAVLGRLWWSALSHSQVLEEACMAVPAAFYHSTSTIPLNLYWYFY